MIVEHFYVYRNRTDFRIDINFLSLVFVRIQGDLNFQKDLNSEIFLQEYTGQYYSI